MKKICLLILTLLLISFPLFSQKKVSNKRIKEIKESFEDHYKAPVFDKKEVVIEGTVLNTEIVKYSPKEYPWLNYRARVCKVQIHKVFKGEITEGTIEVVSRYVGSGHDIYYYEGQSGIFVGNFWTNPKYDYSEFTEGGYTKQHETDNLEIVIGSAIFQYKLDAYYKNPKRTDKSKTKMPCCALVNQDGSRGNLRIDIAAEVYAFLSSYPDMERVDFDDKIFAFEDRGYFKNNHEKKKVQAVGTNGVGKSEASNSVSISDIYPDIISAGTNSILTITGSGFGDNIGTIEMEGTGSDSTAPGVVETERIILWSDQEIQFVVPSFIFASGERTTTGTGEIKVINSLGESSNEEEVDIEFNLYTQGNYIQVGEEHNEVRYSLPDCKTYDIWIEQSITNKWGRDRVFSCVNDAFQQWNDACTGCFDWAITNIYDQTDYSNLYLTGRNISIIRFGDDIDDNVGGMGLATACDGLGQNNFNPINNFVLTLADPPLDQAYWKLPDELGFYPDNDTDVYFTLLHEIGHILGLQHAEQGLSINVANSEQIMYWQAPTRVSGEPRVRVNLHSRDIEAIQEMANFSSNLSLEEHSSASCIDISFSDLYIKDCVDDSDSEPSIDCAIFDAVGNLLDTDIWASPSITNCYRYGQQTDIAYVGPENWSCPSNTNSEYSIDDPVYQLHEGADGTLTQYPNKLTVKIENNGCIDFVQGANTVLKTYWTFARTDEAWPDHWVDDVGTASDGTQYLRGSCMKLESNNITTNGNDGSCVEVEVPDISSNSSIDVDINWHPPAPVPGEVLGLSDELAVNPELCLLARIESNIDPMLDEVNGRIAANVYYNNNIATKNTIYLTSDIIDDPNQGPGGAPAPFPPTPQNNINQLDNTSPTGPNEPSEPTGPSPTTPTTPTNPSQNCLKVVMVNNAEAIDGTIDINFRETTSNGEDLTDFGNLFIYPNDNLWGKLEDSNFEGSGYEINDVDNRVLKMTEGSGFKMTNLAFQLQEVTYIGFCFQPHASGKKAHDRELEFNHFLDHTISYKDFESNEKVSRKSHSGINFKSIIKPKQVFQADELTDLSNGALKAIPNPTSGQTQLIFYLKKSANTALNLYNSQGKKMYTLMALQKLDDGIHSHRIDLSNLQFGMYFIDLVIDGKHYSQKIIVE